MPRRRNNALGPQTQLENWKHTGALALLSGALHPGAEQSPVCLVTGGAGQGRACNGKQASTETTKDIKPRVRGQWEGRRSYPFAPSQKVMRPTPGGKRGGFGQPSVPSCRRALSRERPGRLQRVHLQFNKFAAGRRWRGQALCATEGTAGTRQARSQTRRFGSGPGRSVPPRTGVNSLASESPPEKVLPTLETSGGQIHSLVCAVRLAV